MPFRIGIRHEDKSALERRAPLIPQDVKDIQDNHDIRFVIQPSPTRFFSDAEYINAGAEISDDLSQCPVILGIKEIPVSAFHEKTTYLFFAHVIKGQKQNMPMLKRMMELKCNLIDYERIIDETGKRLVFFGREAGIAGMINTLWALGLRLQKLGFDTPFLKLTQAKNYSSLNDAENAVRDIGEEISRNGIPDKIHPLTFGFAGYGNVSLGAQHIFDLLPSAELSPSDLIAPDSVISLSNRLLYKVVFRESDLVEPKDPYSEFSLQDYYDHPEKYRGVFEKFVPKLSVLVNCIFWSEKYPRLITIDQIREIYSESTPKLQVVGDISCDVNGAVEFTVKETYPDNPVYTFDIDTGRTVDGVDAHGPVVMAVTILPTELPQESSIRFSSTLKPLIPEIPKIDFSLPTSQVKIHPYLRPALILHNGILTPDYEYISKFL